MAAQILNGTAVAEAIKQRVAARVLVRHVGDGAMRLSGAGHPVGLDFGRARGLLRRRSRPVLVFPGHG